MLDALWVDIRHSVRGLRRSPAFSAVVIATFALTIAANTAIFSLFNAIVLRPLAVPDPHRLVAISTTDAQTTQAGTIYAETLSAFRAEQRSFATLSMYAGAFAPRIEARGPAVYTGVEGVTPEYLEQLGARLEAGRFLTETDNAPAGAETPVAVISDRFWERIFSRDPRAIGETLTIDSKRVTIVGVTAPGFYGLQLDSGSDLFVPLSVYRVLMNDLKRPLRARYVIGQLAPGVTIEQARTEVLARWPAIQTATVPASLPQAEQNSFRSQRVALDSVATGFSLLRTLYGSSLKVVVGLTAILLAIACVNLTALLLARGLAREYQFAVRIALGTTRARLVQQSLLDGLLLALCGLVVALPLAWWASRAFTAMASLARAVPLHVTLTPDVRVLAIATAVTIATGMLVGIVPAWRAARRPADGALRPGRAVARTWGRSGRLLLAVQVALSMVLVVGAGLFAGTLSRLSANVDNVRTRPIVWTRLTRSPGDRGTPLPESYPRQLIQALSEIPGVEAAALSSFYPAYFGAPFAPTKENFVPVGESESSVAAAQAEFVSPGFFDMFGIARLRGRDFTWNDDGTAPGVAIVSDSLARKMFPAGDAIGRRVRLSSGATRPELEIIGVVADATIGGLRDPHPAVMFRPMMQDVTRAQAPMASVRVTGDLTAVRDGYVRAVESQGRHFIRGLFTLDEWINLALLPERLIARLSTFGAVLAIFLACVGLYGLLAYAVTSRVREIGIRMALGASRASVAQMIVRDGLVVVVPGVLIGVPCALAAGTLVRSQLYGLAANDPMTIAGAAVVFTATGLAAALLPALRASKIDPTEALRRE